MLLVLVLLLPTSVGGARHGESADLCDDDDDGLGENEETEETVESVSSSMLLLLLFRNGDFNLFLDGLMVFGEEGEEDTAFGIMLSSFSSSSC